jgi:hypothetical protein
VENRDAQPTVGRPEAAAREGSSRQEKSVGIIESRQAIAKPDTVQADSHRGETSQAVARRGTRADVKAVNPSWGRRAQDHVEEKWLGN